MPPTKLKQLAEQYAVNNSKIANYAQLWNFVVKALSIGYTPVDIKKYLLSVGWEAQKIDDVLQDIKKTMEGLES